jgi:hypothetical protein
VFTKDTRTETFLSQMGVAYSYTNAVDVSQLRKGWEIRNLARPKPQREDAIVEYAALMESGSPAPAPILHRRKAGTYDVLDGVQRISAKVLSGGTKLSAYDVTCDSEDILAAIRVLSNARLQGRAESPEWTRRRAVEVLVVDRNLSAKEVAMMGGWKPSDIESITKAIEWGSAIRSIGGPLLPDNMIEVVSAHATKEDIRAAAKPTASFFQALKAARFSAADAELHIEEFFAPVASKNRHSALDDRLVEFKSLPEVQVRITGRKGSGLSRDVVLRRSMRTAISVLEEIEQDGSELLYVDEFFRLVKKMESKLHQLAPNHARAVSVAVPADKWSE